MVIPLNKVQTHKQKASKPGNIIDNYIKVQDINSALNEAEDEISTYFTHPDVQKVIFDILNKWIRI